MEIVDREEITSSDVTSRYHDVEFCRREWNLSRKLATRRHKWIRNNRLYMTFIHTGSVVWREQMFDFM